MILGSPPPTRGTLKIVSIQMIDVRITPAYAGNTCSPSSFLYLCRDHPRLRGEHDIREQMKIYLEGSPPPTRGTLFKTVPPAPFARITPAYAGNTLKMAQ